MSKKIFISYKYGDTSVFPLKTTWEEMREPTKVRDYVTQLQDIFENTHINKGEADDESLEGFQDDTIESKLRNKIYDSSVTLVVVSPNMKNPYEPESDQWIPWEVAYSLREKTRADRTSRTNAVLAVVLPDRNSSYNYFIEDRNCCPTGCRLLRTDTLFTILQKNMFCQKKSDARDCSRGDTVYYGESSYILSVKWKDFKEAPNVFIDRAIKINENIGDYEITKKDVE